MHEVLPTPALTQASNSRSVHWSDRSTDREESAPLVVDSLVRRWGGHIPLPTSLPRIGGNEVVEEQIRIPTGAEKTDRGSLLNGVTEDD
jgi:hypothetical protein